MSKKVVVVGAAGFLGRACMRDLAATGCEVVGIDLVPPVDGGEAGWFISDVLAHGVPAEALAGADVLVNLAWRNDPGRGNADMEHDVTTNVACAVRVFEQAARGGVGRIVYASSGGTIYGHAAVPMGEDLPIAPIGGYGAGKAAAELYLGAMHHAHGVQTCSLRIANPYGPGQYPGRGQGFIATAIAQTLRREPLKIFGSTTISRDYVHVHDVARAVTLACQDDGAQTILNVGSGIDLKLSEIIDKVFAAVGNDTAIEYLPGRAMDVARVALDISRIHATLGWAPAIEIDRGLVDSVAWIKATLNA